MIIALACDIKYSAQAITLIKSICYHKHRNVKFYLLHKDFPNEWFNVMNHYLNQLDCEIISATILHDHLQNYPTAEHITEVTYYRYYLQEIPEDRVLYLDSDIVVNGNLYDFYYQNFYDKSAVAVTDMYVNNSEHFHNIRPYFNAGVLLVNNKKWKKQNIQGSLLAYSEKFIKKVIYADQDILNIVLNNDIIVADKIYNFQAGARFGFYPQGKFELSKETEKLDQDPLIIHYTSPYKPWLISPDALFRDKYWFYFSLEWQDIIQRNLEKEGN